MNPTLFDRAQAAEAGVCVPLTDYGVAAIINEVFNNKEDGRYILHIVLGGAAFPTEITEAMAMLLLSTILNGGEATRNALGAELVGRGIPLP